MCNDCAGLQVGWRSRGQLRNQKRFGSLNILETRSRPWLTANTTLRHINSKRIIVRWGNDFGTNTLTIQNAPTIISRSELLMFSLRGTGYAAAA